MIERWNSWSGGRKFVAVVIGASLLLNVVLVALDGIVGGGPGGPASSPTATAGHGTDAYAELLERDGRTVAILRGDLEPGDLPVGSTAILADPIRLSPADADIIFGFLEGGGRLVVAGPATAEVVAAATGADITVGRVAPVGRLDVSIPGGPAGSAVSVAGDDGTRWRGIGDLLPVAGDADAPTLLTGTVGDGRLVALASMRPLHNDNLARADNAALGLGLAGGSETVAFIDRTAAPEGSGFGAVPTPWKWTAAGFAVAAVGLLWSAGARFGPPEPAERALRPARRDHVEAVAAGLRRASVGERRRPDPTPTHPGRTGPHEQERT